MTEKELEKSLFFILENLQKGIHAVNLSVSEVSTIATGTQREVEMIRQSLEKQDGELRNLYSCQMDMKGCLERHGAEIYQLRKDTDQLKGDTDDLREDTQAIKITKTSKSPKPSLMPLRDVGGVLYKALPYLIVAFAVGAAFVGYLLNQYQTAMQQQKSTVDVVDSVSGQK